jgi:hypothetical protein
LVVSRGSSSQRKEKCQSSFHDLVQYSTPYPYAETYCATVQLCDGARHHNTHSPCEAAHPWGAARAHTWHWHVYEAHGTGNMSSLTIALLCKGRGADAKSYKPDRDDSQWWSRRDALVRCVTSALFSSRCGDHNITVILIFDEDWSFFKMSYGGGDGFLPTERAVVTLWKESASKPNQTIDHDGLSCRLTLSHISTEQPAFENKRQVLEYLQKHCSLDFLRQQGLNASSAVLLRKTNMTKLLQTWQTWNATTKKQAHNNSPPLETIFNDILDQTTEQPVIAGILHESSQSELPCFVQGLETRTAPPNLRICLFLGAVRDMHPQENQLLRKCCSSRTIPLVQVRLGPVPEFTSKIVAVAVFHHANGKLGSAMWNLHGNTVNDGTTPIPKSPSAMTTPSIVKTTTLLPPTELHVLLNLALESHQIVAETKQQQRVRSLWMLVRVTVCTLWRSRLAGGTAAGGGAVRSTSPLVNSLTIVFRDQTSLTLCQDDLVQDMAEQHQAAPSEHQILKAIRNKLDDELVPFHKERLVSVATACTACLDLTRTESPTNKGRCIDFSTRFYNSTQDFAATGKVLLLLGDENSSHLVGFLRKTGVQAVPTKLIHRNVIDWEASSIVMIQHLLYQHRLLPLLRERESNGKNSKRARTR